MSFTSTTNYSLQKPAVGTELDDWGDELNGNWDIVSTQMKLNADAAAAATIAAAGKSPLGHTHTTGEVTGLDAALLGKAPTSHSHVIANVTDLPAALALKAPLDYPTLSGVPTTPTATAGTNNLQIANTAFVTAAITAAATSPVGGGIVIKGASSTLLLTDAGNLVSMDVGTANTLTIPTDAAVAFPTNTEIDIVQHGAGQTTINGPGVTLRASGGKLKLTAQYSGATIKKRGANDWYIWGDLSA